MTESGIRVWQRARADRCLAKITNRGEVMDVAEGIRSWQFGSVKMGEIDGEEVKKVAEGIRSWQPQTRTTDETIGRTREVMDVAEGIRSWQAEPSRCHGSGGTAEGVRTLIEGIRSW